MRACVPFLSCALMGLFSLEQICHPLIQHHCPRDYHGAKRTRARAGRTSEKEPKEADAGKRRADCRREGEGRQTDSREGAVTGEDKARKTRADKEGGGRGAEIG